MTREQHSTAQPPADAPFAGRYAVLSAVMLGSIMGPIDASIVNVVLPTITQAFGVDIATAEWIPTVYLLTISTLLLLFGRIGDILSYRKVYLTGLASFIIASGFCGLAPSMHMLIAFRALQGIGASMMMAVSFAIVTAAFPATERGKALGINAISVSAGLTIGPSLGGFLTSALGWRFVFLINIPIGVAALLWGRHVLPAAKGQPGRLDLPGVFTGFIFLLSLLLFINSFQSGTVDLTAGVMLCIAVVSGGIFLWLESRVPHPMLNLTLFRNATFTLASLSALLNFMAQFVLVFLTPFYLHRVLHFGPHQIGLVMTSAPLAVMAIAPFSGSLSDRIGTSTLASLGAGICAAALFLMSRLPADAAPAAIVWRLVLFGMGTGIFQSPNNSAVMGNAPRPFLGVASGILATVRNVGMVLGIAAAGAVLYRSTPAGILGKDLLEGGDAAAFLSGLENAFLLGAVMTAIAGVASVIRGRGEKDRQGVVPKT